MSNPEHGIENNRKKGTPENEPLQPLYTTIKHACKTLWQTMKQIAIDERMVAAKGKIAPRQYLKAKVSQV